MTFTARRSRALASAAATVALGLAVAGCSTSGSGGTGTESGVTVTAKATTGSPALSSPSIRITITDTTVSPGGALIQAKVNQPITLLINATKAGELHVHSTPEQHVEYPKGESIATVKIPTPGSVVIESHALDKVIAKVEAS